MPSPESDSGNRVSCRQAGLNEVKEVKPGGPQTLRRSDCIVRNACHVGSSHENRDPAAIREENASVRVVIHTVRAGWIAG